MNWPHGPTHWLFEPGLYIVTARHLSPIAAFRFAVAAGFFSGVLVPMRPRIWLELARLGSTRQSLPLRCCVVVGPTDTAKIPWQASHADGQAAQPFGQHTGTESLVSILGKPYHVRTLVSGAAKLCPS